MRLIDTKAYSSTKTFILKDFIGSNIPEYAILSHTWGKPEDEVTLKDIEGGHAEEKDACRKLRFLCRRAIQDGLLWAWCDTCCIDKTSAVELAEAINSMYRWYKHATKCYALLSDVCARGTGDWQRLFRGSRWFTRCWTLQELLAPTTIDFFSAEYDHIGDKNLLLQMISEITGISIEALKTTDFSGMGIDERFDWMRGRNATREEDEAYSLFGIFGVQLPLLYGEGVEEAVKRLRKKIIKKAKEAAVPGNSNTEIRKAVI